MITNTSGRKALSLIVAVLATITILAFGTAVFADSDNDKTVVLKDGKNTIDVTSYYLQMSYKATKSGKLTMTFSEDPGPITLTDSKGNTISDKTYAAKDGDKSKFVWAVRKGVTYKLYIWEHTTAARHYFVKLSTKKIADPNTKKSKAANIKLKKTKDGIVAYGQKDPSWFKVKFTKATKATFIIKGKDIQGNLLVAFYKGSKKVTETRISGGSTMKLYSAAFSGSVNKKIPKGTYYIKVSRWTNISGGDFSITVK